jgi:hypothetical protein
MAVLNIDAFGAESSQLSSGDSDDAACDSQILEDLARDTVKDVSTVVGWLLVVQSWID